MKGQEQQPDLANEQNYLPDLYAPKYVFHTTARIGIRPFLPGTGAAFSPDNTG